MFRVRSLNARLSLQHLEDRTVPAIFGSPWADARDLTISFVPDGTSVDGVGSSLSQAMPPGAWQREILRAFHAWAQFANIDVGLTADGGQALGSHGKPQGDARFGDIRIAARPLSDDVLALTMPSGVMGGTRAGDIVFNSNKAFSIGGGAGTYDVYTVMLQEAGHALGVGNSSDPNSPMYELYSGPRAGLAADDVIALQALYGVRAPDVFDGGGGNNQLSDAKEMKRPSGFNGHQTILVRAELTSSGDVDFFKVKTLKEGNPHGLTIRLDASESLLAPRVTVYGPDGVTALATAQASSPAAGVLQIVLPTVQNDKFYYVKVEDANPAYGVGGYQLKAVFNPTAPAVPAEGSDVPIDDEHTDDNLDDERSLSTAPGYASKTHYTAVATLRDAADVDVYKIRSRKVESGQQNVMTVNVRALAAGTVNPLVAVFDHDRAFVNAQVLVNADGTYTVQLPNALSDKDYFIMVRGDGQGGTGDYRLDVDFRAVLVQRSTPANASLTAAAPLAVWTLDATRSQMVNFALAASGTGVRMTVRTEAGQVVALLVGSGNRTSTIDTYLAAGRYRVTFERVAGDASFSLACCELTDPIGVRTSGGGSSGTGGGSAGTATWTRLS